LIPPHHLTVDVEEYFNASAMEPYLPRSRWDGLDRKAPELVGRLLDLLGEAGVRGTFFVLGWLASREPGMVRAIVSSGHEVASHGWHHERVSGLSPEAFREDVRRARDTLQNLTGAPVVGYRAPSFSIVPGVEWALDVLLEEGFRYDSSMYPVRVHPGYGYPEAPPDPHVLERPSGVLVEIPPATLKLGPLVLPAAGGAYLRFFPLALIRSALKSASSRGVPATLYIHPWETDTTLPRFQAPWKTQLRMRGGIGSVSGKLAALTRDFSFRPMVETVEELLTASRPGAA